MTNSIGLMIESLVAALLAVTIVYCILLNRRLKRLKADEMSLKATISELITATEIAERAVAGLKVTVRECDQDIGERLRAAEKFSADIAGQITAGEELLARACVGNHGGEGLALLVRERSGHLADDRHPGKVCQFLALLRC